MCPILGDPRIFLRSRQLHRLSTTTVDRQYYCFAVLSTMIRSFGTKDTSLIWQGFQVRHYPRQVQFLARRKLRMLNNANQLADLLIPPGNRLEALKGDRKGQYSIRVNDRMRLCFVWKDGDCHEVQLVDYHS